VKARKRHRHGESRERRNGMTSYLLTNEQIKSSVEKVNHSANWAVIESFFTSSKQVFGLTNDKSKRKSRQQFDFSKIGDSKRKKRHATPSWSYGMPF
jgi:hypothetical protein